MYFATGTLVPDRNMESGVSQRVAEGEKRTISWRATSAASSIADLNKTGTNGHPEEISAGFHPGYLFHYS